MEGIFEDPFYVTRNNPAELRRIHHNISASSIQSDDGPILINKIFNYDSILSYSKINFRVTCFTCISQTFIMGTNLGTVLLYSLRDLKLTSILGREGFSTNLGSVSSLDYHLSFKNNLSLLLVGHARGPITLWDCSQNKCLHLCSDVATRGASIILARFSSNPYVCCILDSFGYVFITHFSNVLGVHSYDSYTLKSIFISEFEICVLNFSFFLPTISTSIDKLGLVVFSTTNNVYISIINPKPRCLSKLFLGENTLLLPQVAWLPPKNEFDDILLAIGHDKTIRILIIFHDHMRSSICDREFAVLHLTHEIITLDWLGPSALGILDPGECFHLVDIILHQELETLDISNISLIYGSQFFKSYEACGKSHPLFASVSRHACFNSISNAFDNERITINFLGQNSILTYYLPDWKSRIDILLSKLYVFDALNLAKSFIDGTAGAVIGLSFGIEERKIQLSETIYRLALVYSEISLKSPNDCNSNDFDSSHVKKVAKFAIDCCLASGLSNDIFGELFEKFKSHGSSHSFIFYQAVSEFIIDDKFPAILPTYANFLIDIFVEKGNGNMLETIIPYLKVKGDLDIKHIIEISADKNLYGLFLYSYSVLLGEFITPLKILVEILYVNMESCCELSEKMEIMGYKLFVYLNGCLSGQNYCNQSLSMDIVKDLKEEILLLLLSYEVPGIISSANPYPYLRIFLLFSHKDFFNVLTIAFNSDDLSNSPLLARSIDAFITIFFEQNKTFENSFVDCHYLSLLTYLTNVNKISEPKIMVPFDFFIKMLNSIKLSKTISHFMKEQLLLELLCSGSIPDRFSKNSMLVWALEGRFYQVCEKIYISRRQYVEVLQCYWNEPLRTPYAFKLINFALSGNELSPSEKQDILSETLRRILILIHISARLTAELVFLFCPDQIDIIVKYHLKECDNLQFEFLQNIMNFQQVENTCQSETVNLSIEMQDIYIELLAKFKPTEVLSYLHQTDQFRIHHVLDISKRYYLQESCAFLYERLNKYDEAFIILLNNLKEELFKLPSSIDLLLYKLGLVMGLLERTTRSLNESQRESFWFQLLDSISETNPDMPHFMEIELLRTLLKSLNAHVSLPALFQKILNENFSNSIIITDFREMMLNMLNGCTYQVNTLNTVYAVINRDLDSNFKCLRLLSRKAVKSKSLKCAYCCRFQIVQYKKSTVEELIVFNCSHSLHIECEKDWLLKNNSEFNSYSCPTCNPKAKQGFVYSTDKSWGKGEDRRESILNTSQRRAIASVKHLLYIS